VTAREFADPRARRACLAIGIGATVLAALAGTAAPAQFFAAWLFAWLCVLGIALGAMANVMIHELTGGEWGFVVRAPLEAALATLPAVALLGVPLVFGLAHLYPWAAHAGDPAFAGKRWYLNTPFFVVRAALDFAIWIALATALRRQWSRHRTNAAPVARPALRVLSIAGLVLYAVTMTLAAVDWIMALSADWYATGFGLLVLTSQAFGAFAFAVAVGAASGEMRGARAVADDRNAAMVERPNPARDAQDLGNILLTYAMLWAYLAFMQFLVIWAEDLPAEIGWYVARATPPWKALAVVVFALQFVVPFVAMLFRGFKRDPARLGALCGVVLVAHVLEIAWEVLPASPATPPWLAVLALLAVGALWLHAFMVAHSRAAPAPRRADFGVEHG
jgi:hypothetical protein